MGLNVGTARTAITPPLGVELAGYGFGPSAGVLDDLEAQALYLEGGDTATGVVAAAIVAADLLTRPPAAGRAL
jgi:hypothetical protein